MFTFQTILLKSGFIYNIKTWAELMYMFGHMQKAVKICQWLLFFTPTCGFINTKCKIYGEKQCWCILPMLENVVQQYNVQGPEKTLWGTEVKSESKCTWVYYVVFLLRIRGWACSVSVCGRILAKIIMGSTVLWLHICMSVCAHVCVCTVHIFLHWSHDDLHAWMLLGCQQPHLGADPFSVSS